MLALRPCCEHCGTDLPPNSTHAMICSYECTFCADCVDQLFTNVCPNCGGGFVPRPIRPAAQLDKYPPKKERLHRPVDLTKYQELYLKNKHTPPEKR